MIVPSRWFSGGKGLDEFRDEMLNDKRISNLIDFSDSRDCFPEVDISGGVCYFVWEKEYHNTCRVVSIHKDKKTISNRYLNEFETFIRDNIAVDIVKKVTSQENQFIDKIVSSRMPFGISTTAKFTSGNLPIITSSGIKTIAEDEIKIGIELINKWNVLLSKASNDHGGQPDKEGKRRIFAKVDIMPPQTVCTESYLAVGNFDTESEALNMSSYLRTKFCRFLVSTILLTQNITKSKFAFVPMQDFSESWTDEKLYKKYGLTADEIAFIDSMIRPMEL